jgi:hypothetical protein
VPEGDDIIGPEGHTRTIFYAGVSTADDWPAGRYWTTLGALLADIHWPESALLTRALRLYSAPLATVVGSFSSWPIFYDSTVGENMRWIRHTLRGTLGGTVEQFQHKMDWGHPGADPDISEAEAGALAVQLATAWKTAFISDPTLFSSDVKYTESGIVQLTQTSAVDKHGVGDKPEESFGTQWFMWPVGTEPVGTSSSMSLPYEVSLAITLQTDHRGPSGRGRAYLPPPAVSQMSPHGVFGSSAKAMSYILCQYVMAGITATPYVPVVVSRRRLLINEITSIHSGHVPDSQRRRRRSQDEARQVDWTKTGGLV